MPKQAIVQSSIEAIGIVETSIPAPKDFEVIIKVAVCGSNPKDWKYPFWCVSLEVLPISSCHTNVRLSTIGKTGLTTVAMTWRASFTQWADVYEFRPGDRVAVLHQFQTPNGAFVEFARAPA